MAGENVDALRFKPEGLDHAHAIHAFAQFLIHLVIGFADRAVQPYQTVGLRHEQRQSGQRHRERHHAQPGVVPAEQADGGDQHQRCFEHLAPEIDQRIAHLVGVSRGAGDQFAHAVLPVVGQIQPLNLGQDAFAQHGEQVLPDHQRHDAAEVLQHRAQRRDARNGQQPVQRHGPVQAAVGGAADRVSGLDVIDRAAHHPLLEGDADVHQHEQPGGQRKTAGHQPVQRQAAQHRRIPEQRAQPCLAPAHSTLTASSKARRGPRGGRPSRTP